MPVISQMVSPKALGVEALKKVIVLRDTQGLAWDDIAAQVFNVSGKAPSRQHVINSYHQVSKKKGCGVRKYKYKNCGRGPWKLTKDVKAFLVRRLLVLRKDCVCTAVTLQRELAREKGLRVDVSKIRQALRIAGFRWLPRTQKPKHSKEAMAARVAFAQEVLSMSRRQLRAKLGMAMDGVVLGMPPSDPTDRANHCRIGDMHMWQKRGEQEDPKLAGGGKFGKQIPLARAVALWGGVSASGFQIVLMHDRKKLTSQTWAAQAVDSGKLKDALKALNPQKPAGPWTVLCDNESFLRAPASREAHRKAKVSLWQIPAKSPDLNPVEKFWGWLRKELRMADLKDLVAKRPALGKIAYRRRVKNICRSQRAQRVARNIALGLKRVCREVVKKKGAATRG